ncbi:hypothetical protein ACH4U7_11815 [Streptomyces sp. NPDC020845]|uniref:hypothetical protein n=1 Tax=Streptomyces sp. NPDC020845 TaxID=3365096 RepID=UPI0037A086F2
MAFTKIRMATWPTSRPFQLVCCSLPGTLVLGCSLLVSTLPTLLSCMKRSAFSLDPYVVEIA